MGCSAQKVKVAVKSAKTGASSHVTNSILKNAAKWLVYASTMHNKIYIQAADKYIQAAVNPLDPTDEFTRHFGPLHLW